MMQLPLLYQWVFYVRMAILPPHSVVIKQINSRINFFVAVYNISAIMVFMKKLPALFMVMALLVMSFASVSHAACDQPGGCGDFEIMASVDDHGNEDGEKQNAMCDCCATCGKHHHHAAFVGSKAEPVMVLSQTVHSSHGDTYLSQLNYPPSKPPQS